MEPNNINFNVEVNDQNEYAQNDQNQSQSMQAPNNFAANQPAEEEEAQVCDEVQQNNQGDF